MSEFHDPDLRQELARLSGPYPDDNAAFAALQRRVGQARRRRAMAWTTGAALSVLLGSVGVAALNSPGRHTLVPAKSTESSDDVSTTSTTTMVKESSTIESTEPQTSESTVVETTPIIQPIDTSVVETQVAVTAATGGGSNNGSPKPHAPVTSAVPVVQPTSQTFSSVGGSITVQRDGDKLTVVHVSPAAGFQADEKKHSGDRLEVTFESDTHRSTITVRIVNGVVTPNVSDKSKDQSHQDTTPESTDGHTKGDGGNN